MTGKRQAAEKRGRTAEMLAATMLRLKGYRILEQRYRSAYGEIDLIAERGGTIIMIEVKARKSEASAKESVTPRQRKRIEQAALDWLAKNGRHENAVRFDVIAIVPGSLPTHIKDAWRPGL